MWKVCLISLLAAVHCNVLDKTEGAEESRIGLEELVNIAFPDNSTSCPLGQECVPFYLCTDSKTIIEDGKGLINLRMDGFDETEYECKEYLDVCCATSDTTHLSIVDTKPAADGCGFGNMGGIGFKIREAVDHEAEFGEFPWMVAILTEEIIYEQPSNLYQCGGSLIAPSVVLTAAHCVESIPAHKMKVRAGEWDTQTKKEVLEHQDRRVAEVIIHPHFDNGTAFNDIALLFLDTAFVFDAHINTVCLPPPNYNFDHANCFVTGWGKDNFERIGKYAVILKKIDLPVVPNPLCQRQLRETRLGKFFKLHPSFICAGGEAGKDACTGDGGSPLVCPIPNTPNRYYQAGVVAWGIGCGEANVPGVYANVAKLQPWIEEQVKATDRSYYTL